MSDRHPDRGRKVKSRSHFVIPDTQVKPGVRTDHLDWIGKYIRNRKPDVLVQIGDWYDMPSLSSYDRGRKAAELRRYKHDIEAGNRALERLEKAIGPVDWEMEKEWFMGNHEHRIDLAVEEDPRLEGTLSTDHFDFARRGWKVHEFLEPAVIDGITYCHFFPRGPRGAITQSKRGAPSAFAQLQRQGGSCTGGHQQGLDVACMPLRGGLQWGMIAGSCLVPDHRVLTADLRYVPLGDIKAGDKLVSFDEFPNTDGLRSRRYRTGTVLRIRPDVADVFAVELASGKVFLATADHLWLRRSGTGTAWIQTQHMTARGPSGATHVPPLLAEWDPLTTYDAGWLAGMYDGEGCLYRRKTTAGYVMQLGMSQKPGAVLDRARDLHRTLLNLDVLSETVSARSASILRVRGGTTKIAEVLGKLRPSRLLPKFQPEMLGRVCHRGGHDAVTRVRPAGRREITRVDVDAKTMIVEGYGHHNCYLHEEKYLTPQGTDYWRGVIVKHGVKNGTYCPMFVDLEYLRKRYA